MTACVNPLKEVYGLVVSDSNKRRKQYEDALLFYIYNTEIKKIVFCDNSNTKMDVALIEKAHENGKELELLNFQGNSMVTIEKGKGYGEGEILEYVLKRSHLINKCKYIAKVTGRLQVLNLNGILKCAFKHQSLVNIYDMSDGPFADTKFLVLKKTDFQDYLMESYKDVDDKNGVTLESCYAKAILENDVKYKNFPVYINFKGYSGTTGMQYALDKKIRYRISLKNFLIYILPYQFNKLQPSQWFYNSLELDDNIWKEKYSDYTGMKVAIYGAGTYGYYFYRLCKKFCKVKLWVDKNYKTLKIVYDKKIDRPSKLIGKNNLDYIFIAVKSEKAQNEILSDIHKMSVITPIEVVKDLY
jgi:hypothetical protein